LGSEAFSLGYSLADVIGENVNYAIKPSIVKNIIDLVPNQTLKNKNRKMKKLKDEEKISLLSDFVVMIQTF
jgi:hypothetical protein